MSSGGADADDIHSMAAMGLPTGFGGPMNAPVSGGAVSSARKLKKPALSFLKKKTTKSSSSAGAGAGAGGNSATATVGVPRSQGLITTPSSADLKPADNAEHKNALAEQQQQQQNRHEIPTSHEAILGAGEEGTSKAVTAVALDRAGNRCVTGSHDGNVRIYDFHGMNSEMAPFRTLEEPCGSYAITSVSFSPSGDRFLVVPSSPCPKVFNRDGREVCELTRGDMYVRDMKNTKGHTAACCGGQWHPAERAALLTCSEDGTARIWDVERPQNQVAVLKPRQRKPGRFACRAACYSPDGGAVAAAFGDGSLQVWDVRGGSASGLTAAYTGMVASSRLQASSGGAQLQSWSYSQKTTAVCFDAHAGGDAGDAMVCSLAFHADNRTLVSRAQDGTLKLWDVRSLSKPVAVASDLAARYDETACVFSPDVELAYTAVSAPEGSGGDGSGGAVAFFDSKTLRPVSRIGLPSSAVAVQWHAGLNQLFVGCAKGREGETRVLYDPSLSTKGVLVCKDRKARVPDAADMAIAGLYQGTVYTPHALPMFREPMSAGAGGGGGGARKRARDGALMAPPKSDSLPVGKVGAGGQLGTSEKAVMMRQIMEKEFTKSKTNARDAFLSHDDGGAAASEKKDDALSKQ